MRYLVWALRLLVFVAVLMFALKNNPVEFGSMPITWFRTCR